MAKRLAQVNLSSKDISKKYELLESIKPELFNLKPMYQLFVGGVRILLCFDGPDAEHVYGFLPKYFAHFDLHTQEIEASDVIITYRQPDNDLKSEHSTLWNDWPHEIEFLSSKGLDKIMARDFVAKISKEAEIIYAFGPKWSFETCDSLDNLVSYALSRHLIKYQGLIVHAACVVVKDDAYVFFGASGAGKSTLAEFCYRHYGFKVISSDQVIVRYEHNVLYAQVMPTTIPEFPLNHPARETRNIRIKSINHLVQSEQEFCYSQMIEVDWLKTFMRELVYRNEFGNEKEVLDLCLKITQDKTIIKAEMSYKKEYPFFENLIINENANHGYKA